MDRLGLHLIVISHTHKATGCPQWLSCMVWALASPAYTWRFPGRSRSSDTIELLKSAGDFEKCRQEGITSNGFQDRRTHFGWEPASFQRPHSKFFEAQRSGRARKGSGCDRPGACRLS
jgi:hypothetical protein